MPVKCETAPVPKFLVICHDGPAFSLTNLGSAGTRTPFYARNVILPPPYLRLPRKKGHPTPSEALRFGIFRFLKFRMGDYAQLATHTP
jgi:hypothetical protein